MPRPLPILLITLANIEFQPVVLSELHTSPIQQHNLTATVSNTVFFKMFFVSKSILVINVHL